MVGLVHGCVVFCYTFMLAVSLHIRIVHYDLIWLRSYLPVVVVLFLFCGSFVLVSSTSVSKMSSFGSVWSHFLFRLAVSGIFSSLESANSSLARGLGGFSSIVLVLFLFHYCLTAMCICHSMITLESCNRLQVCSVHMCGVYTYILCIDCVKCYFMRFIVEGNDYCDCCEDYIFCFI